MSTSHSRRPSAAATRTLELRRPQLREDGNVELTTHTVRVTIPAGVTQGQLIRLAGQGERGRRGGAAGDLYLEAHILPQQLFALDGRDVTLIFPVAPWEVGARRLRDRADTGRLGRDAHSGGRSLPARSCGCADVGFRANRQGISTYS